MIKAATYAYRDRKARKRDFRGIWIMRINAAARQCGMTYSTLINGLTHAKILINRKMLAELAVFDFDAFQGICEQAKKAS